MLKKIVSLCLALVLLGVPLSVFAEGDNQLVYDHASFFTETEVNTLTETFRAVGEKHGCELIAVTETGLDDDGVTTFLDSFLEANPFSGDGILIFLSDEFWEVRTTYGKMGHLFSDDILDAIWDAMSESIEQESMCQAFEIFAKECDAILTGASTQNALVVDDADLLSDSFEASLLTRLQSMSQDLDCRVVIVTKNSIDGFLPEEYADDYFDYHDYGADGVLFLITMQERKWHVSTAGWCIEAVNDAGLSHIEKEVVSFLSDAEYEKAFSAYCDSLEEVLKPYRTTGKAYKAPLQTYWIFVALGVGAIVALMVVHSMVQKLKTVRFQPAATSYVREGSFKVNESKDVYLYSHVSKTLRESSSSSSGGGGSHTSSSGSSHGGGGGSF